MDNAEAELKLKCAECGNEWTTTAAKVASGQVQICPNLMCIKHQEDMSTEWVAAAKKAGRTNC